MAKELFIVFLYDTEAHLREEEDPQTAVVFFHPSWVKANQRMALCGQLIGVTQCLAATFQFPYTISLQSGEFCMKRIGRFILCVGTDRNVPEWILEERCEILYETLRFFHNDLSDFGSSTEQKLVAEKLNNAMEVYLPVLLYAGNIFCNSITVRLPKSASSIFLETAQLLECLQSNEGVYGGAIFHRNKILMSQLDADVTKQIVIVDPYRVKIPASMSNSLEILSGVQLLLVYVSCDKLTDLRGKKMPLDFKSSSAKLSAKIDKLTTLEQQSKPVVFKKRNAVFAVKEEEPLKKMESSTNPKSVIPDVVRDTVKTVQKKLEKRNKYQRFHRVEIDYHVIHSCAASKSKKWSSSKNLFTCILNSSRFNNCEEELSPEPKSNLPSASSRRKLFHRSVRNSIADPTCLWFRCNGLPVSQAFKDDQITNEPNQIPITTAAIFQDEIFLSVTEPVIHSAPPSKRPTSIKINPKSDDERQSRFRKSMNILRDLKREFSDSSLKDPKHGNVNDIPLTPLMSKLSMWDVSESGNTNPVVTPAPCLPQMRPDINAAKETLPCKSNRKIKSRSRRKQLDHSECSQINRAILFVYGFQNISVHILLKDGSEKNTDLIHNLKKICLENVGELEEHFEQFAESVPQTQEMQTANESYSHLNLHSVWETLHQGGTWTGPQVDFLNTMHNDFNTSKSITDIIFRMDDSILYGSQMADSQMFYQQSAATIAGLPMPSDPMATVPLKAKRRLERDHGLLIL